MERGSSKHGPRVDDQMAGEIEGVVRSGHPTRAQEGREPEPVVNDDGDPAMAPEAEKETTEEETAEEE
ncbi:MAG: hypothetical protein M0026_04540 [Nocardiopsaceae bacterium]|nr:hypothetical protein [Nocardiopsaceae bacterium]